MPAFLAKCIEKKTNVSIASGQTLYKKLFLKIKIYAEYKDDTDAILYADGYGEVIVES